ncbi:N-acetylmuramate alpha-1-phosphate uridylyltransferase MurU [Acidihalobacter prosperus]
MRAMILAAGRGKRMQPLTNTCPKPLLSVGGKPLIVHQLERLAIAGYREIVINIAYRGDMIRDALGRDAGLGLQIDYSDEGDHPLETGGGISKALPLLGTAPFLVVNSDIWCDYPLKPHELGEDLAHLVMVDNPPQHAGGDFHLDKQGRICLDISPKLTFSGIGHYRPELFADTKAGAFRLASLLEPAIMSGRVSGTHHQGTWFDIGTPQRLVALDKELRKPDPLPFTPF